MEVVKCFLYSVIWTITSNYQINYYTSMFNDIHAIQFMVISMHFNSIDM